jgi:hypothetical protein
MVALSAPDCPSLPRSVMVPPKVGGITEIQALEWRDFQLHGIGFVVLAVLAAGAHGRGNRV